MAATPTKLTMEYVDDDEVLLGTIRKHPFGIVIIYLLALLGIIFALGLAFLLLPPALSDTKTAYSLATAFSIFAVVFAVVIMVISTIIYKQSYLVITDKNITQVLQGGLFQRKISQLTMANVEDVTSEQRGIFASIFNFGILKIETAGEQANFHFSYCPRPSYYAKIILEAREKFTSKDYPYTNDVRGKYHHAEANPPEQV